MPVTGTLDRRQRLRSPGAHPASGSGPRSETHQGAPLLPTLEQQAAVDAETANLPQPAVMGPAIGRHPQAALCFLADARSSIGPCGALRAGDYKLIEWFDETICGPGNEFELYNLKEDIGEQNNLAGRMPKKTRQLKEMLATWRVKVGAQMLTPNPNYDPQKAKRSGKRG